MVEKENRIYVQDFIIQYWF